jgi:hypothetical protein
MSTAEGNPVKPLLCLPVLALLAASALPAQKTQTVVIEIKGQNGPAADAVASYLEGQIESLLLDQYPCVDVISDTDIKSLLDNERERRLLGGEDSDLLSNLAGALGAQTVITIDVNTTSSQTLMSASAMNMTTAQPTDKGAKVTGNGDAALDGAEALAKEFVAGLTALKGVCDIHWKGTISYHERQNAGATTTDHKTGGRGANGQTPQGQSTTTTKWVLDDLVEVVLMPMSLGASSVNNPMAKFTHGFSNENDNLTSSSGTDWCREPDSNPKLEGYGESDLGESYEAYGEKSWKAPVSISLSSDGSYEITIRWDDLPLKWKRHTKEPGGFCPIKPGLEATANGEDSRPGGEYTLHGKTDPAHPDVLTGHDEQPIDASAMPDQGSGSIAVDWNLKLIRPRSKR